jgi:hypothetical protein
LFSSEKQDGGERREDGVQETGASAVVRSNQNGLFTLSVCDRLTAFAPAPDNIGRSLSFARARLEIFDGISLGQLR